MSALGEQFRNRPDVLRNSSFHRRSDAQRLVDATEIVIGVVDRNHVAVILKCLRERIRQSREPPHAHPQHDSVKIEVDAA